jgi:hypothetical protein
MGVRSAAEITAVAAPGGGGLRDERTASPVAAVAAVKPKPLDGENIPGVCA